MFNVYTVCLKDGYVGQIMLQLPAAGDRKIVWQSPVLSSWAEADDAANARLAAALEGIFADPVAAPAAPAPLPADVAPPA